MQVSRVCFFPKLKQAQQQETQEDLAITEDCLLALQAQHVAK